MTNRPSAFRIPHSALLRGFVLLLGYYFAAASAAAQTDTVARQPGDPVRIANAATDTVMVKGAPSHSPRRATMLAALLPGTGQFYNRKYWKVPIVYAGFGVCGYFIYTNNRTYQNFLQAWQAKNNGGTGDGPYIYDRFDPKYPASSRLNNLENLRRNKDQFRRYLELSVIATVAMYALQIIDANVDAHLRGFDWNSENLTLRFEPVLDGNFAGMGLVLRW